MIPQVCLLYIEGFPLDVLLELVCLLQVYDFLKAFLVDLKHTFVDGYIHMGLDEVSVCVYLCGHVSCYG